MYPLIENGHVYIANPPEYKAMKNGNVEYVFDDKDLANRRKAGEAFSELHVLKGLGSMDSKDLYETTFSEKELYLQLETDDELVSYIENLMGTDAQFRKKVIEMEGLL